MPSKKFKIKRPKFYDYFLVEPTTTRACSHEECENLGELVGGHYTYLGRRVRVWVCKSHAVANPLQELPMPADLQAGIDADLVHVEKMKKYYRDNPHIDTDRGVSVKAMAPSGHGKPIPGDPIKSWRWGV
jgi:hypothetical protein